MAPTPRKRSRHALTLDKKHDILKKIDEGWTVGVVVGTMTSLGPLSIKKAWVKLLAYGQTYGQTARQHERKTMAQPRHVELDDNFYSIAITT